MTVNSFDDVKGLANKLAEGLCDSKCYYTPRLCNRCNSFDKVFVYLYICLSVHPSIRQSVHHHSHGQTEPEIRHGQVEGYLGRVCRTRSEVKVDGPTKELTR